MFDDLPSDLAQLRTLRIWHALWVQRIDAKAAAIQQRQAEEEYGRRNKPTPPEWIVELGIGTGRPPLQVHAGDCHMAGRRHRPVDRDEARRLLTQGLKACIHCQPDVLLHIIDLSHGAASAQGTRNPLPAGSASLRMPYDQAPSALERRLAHARAEPARRVRPSRRRVPVSRWSASPPRGYIDTAAIGENDHGRLAR
ncbi:DUF6233 domain-containing protein [Streptomyces anthocyanicus]|uniref:DUF6233 domain-containing protein n=1 Tax=Streptomyces anthocyanicus TaxID=68174 RepID=UPI0037F89FCE